jgi:iron complex outermembrane recepter protein
MVLMACAGIAPAAASAAEPALRVALPAEPATASLMALARTFGIELLFDPRLLGGVTTPAVSGTLTLDAALHRLLGPSGLTWHRLANGTVVIARHAPPRPAPPPPPPAEAAIPEILVEGRRSLNVDIARGEDDIQPYRIVSAATIADAAGETPDDFLKDHLSTNDQALLSTQAPVANNGSTRSQVDLRGLGTAQTLVLVDGHRLPSVPGLDAFLQPDISGVPLGAIDRIETIASTAAGIYGPGATGGVVNLVLKRDPHGFDITLDRGVSSRGDAPRWRIDVHAGYTSPSHDTRLSLYYSHAEDAGLTEGQRPFVAQARQQRYANASQYGIPLPASGDVNIYTRVGDLTLSSALGGGSLGSNETYIPLSAIGTPQEAAILQANAGKLSTALSPDGQGSAQSLLSRTVNDGLTATAEQRLGDRLDAFLDVLAFDSRGYATGPLEYQDGIGWPIADGTLPGSPISSLYTYSFPEQGANGQYQTRDLLVQATLGLVARLGHGWRADLDLTGGWYQSRSRFPLSEATPAIPDVFDAGLLAAYRASLQNYPYGQQTSSDRSYDATLRAAGPLLALRGGDATVTVLLEARGDRNPGIGWAVTDQDYRTSLPIDSPYQEQDIQSGYAELRLPLGGRSGVLRGLEVQLALRGDRYLFSVPYGYPDLLDVNTAADLGATGRIERAYDMLSFTAGARIEPVPGIKLRASYATGSLPPQPVDLIPVNHLPGSPVLFGPITDLQRGGSSVDLSTIDLVTEGSSSLGMAHVGSLTLGAIVEPPRMPGLRIAADYTRIAISHAVSYEESHDPQFFVDHESAYPDRVTRAPLTAADIAAGYTVGAIETIDTGALDQGRIVLDALDLDVSYRHRIGAVAIQAANHLTWTIADRSQPNPFEPWRELAGTLDGPIPIKDDASVSLGLGALTLGADCTIYGAYTAQYAEQGQSFLTSYTALNRLIAAAQGGTRMPAQAYLNLMARINTGPESGRHVTYRLSVHNVLDKTPPFYAPGYDQIYPGQFGLGYSSYGDPRGRYFEVSAHIAL